MCVDFYNPAALEYANASWIFPAATLHLGNQKDPAWPNAYTTCRTMNDGFLDVQMAFSTDGTNFTRLGTSPVVPRGLGQRNPLSGIYDSNGAEWDAGVVFMATGGFHAAGDANHISLYYFGTQLTHGYMAYHVGQEYPDVTRGFGRVRWRKEGFVSLSTSFETGATGRGSFQTRSLRLPNDGAVELLLNVQTAVSGSVVVELLRPNGPSVRTSVPIVGNDLRLPVVWNSTLSNSVNCSHENGPDDHPKSGHLDTDLLSIVGADEFTLRVTMRDAELYSLSFSKLKTDDDDDDLTATARASSWDVVKGME